jgi:hypothetical protein
LNRFLVPPGYLLNNLSSTLTAITNLTLEVARDDNLCEILRDNFGMVQVFTDVFHPSLKPDDINLVLKCLKTLTQDLVVSWKAPYLYKLIDNLYSFIETKFDDKPNLYLALQILINLCRKNVSCLLVAHENAKSKRIWQQLSAGFSTDMKVCGLQEILISHLLFIISKIQRTDFTGGKFNL